MTLSRIMPIYLQLCFKMMIFRNPIRNGTNFLSMTQIPSDDILESLYQLRVRGLRNSRTVGIVQHRDSSLSQIEDDGKKEVSNIICE